MRGEPGEKGEESGGAVARMTAMLRYLGCAGLLAVPVAAVWTLESG